MLLRKVRGRLASSLRTKLLVLVLFPILLVTPLTIGFVIWWSQEYNQSLLLQRVNTDLVVADDVFKRLQRDFLDTLERVAGSHVFYTAFQAGDVESIEQQFASLRTRSGFDFLRVVDLQGRWILSREKNNSHRNRHKMLSERVLNLNTAQVGIEIYEHEDLSSEAPALAQHIRLLLVDTLRAAPTQRVVEDRAMVIHAVAPIFDPNGKILALIDGGVVINKDFDLVDAVRDLVYGPGSLLEGSLGTVTVFLDDVRISTNVPRQPGQRALGTRVSKEVRDSVLGHGDVWLDRAFVVSDWYISGYQPIIDITGKRIGMLYAGFLEAPYRLAYRDTLVIVLVMLVVGIILAALLAISGARAIARPVEAMAAVARALKSGEDRSIGDVQSSDEIGELAIQFDETLRLLRERNLEVLQSADRLELKVAERTAELEEKNVDLEQTIALLKTTRQQLISAEKLAALGELTAGVAHEINNPIAIIQGNLEIIQRELGSGIVEVETEMDLILGQVARIHSIVDKLLDYSRKGLPSNAPREFNLHQVLDDTLQLVAQQAGQKNIQVTTEVTATRTLAMDAFEFQQVLVNLLLNAIQASPLGSEVRLVCRDRDSGGILVSVIDHGVGIITEDLGKVFDPFFSTKGPLGTGLGLSVSYGIVTSHGGQIQARSSASEGTCFDVWLPAVDGSHGSDSEQSVVQVVANG